jgi:hypothetical protein
MNKYETWLKQQSSFWDRAATKAPETEEDRLTRLIANAVARLNTVTGAWHHATITSIPEE